MHSFTKLLFHIRILLFCILVALLPFAEWKFIGFPIKGRPIVIDLNSYMSVSVFDLVFAFFAISCLPVIWQTYKRKILFNWYLFCWGICVILAVIVFFQQQPMLPYLTPTIVNVIDVRSLIIHFVVAVCVALVAIQIPIARIVRGAQVFYIIAALGSAILCYFALSAFLFFRFNYPFTCPATISFPFSCQNMAALFITLCFIGCIGVAVMRGTKILLLLCPPIFLLAAALTGSRSNIFICCIMSFAYVIIYIVYYRYFTLDCIINHKPSHPAILLVSLCIGLCLIYFNINWIPIARSMSIFYDILPNPVNLVTGGRKGAPRYKMWSKSLKSHRIKVSDDKHKNSSISFGSHRFSIGLTSVTEGCKNVSDTISDLTIGRTYYVQLMLIPNGANTHHAILTVFDDPHRQRLVGNIETTFNSPRLSNVYYFIADIGSSRTVYVDADLSDFTKILQDRIENNLLKHQAVQLFEEPFNGGAQPTILLEDNYIRIKANWNKLRGYIYEASLGYDNKKIVFEYTINVKKTKYSSPVDPPAIFYTGLSETDAVHDKASWRSIRNGLLISHELDWGEWRKDCYLCYQKQKFNWWVISKDGRVSSDNNLIELFNNEIRCGFEGQNLISRLWEPMLDDTVLYKKPGRDAYKINNGDIHSLLSLEAGKTWSADDHLDRRGSTHNVYLDWYYYVGPIPFGLFLIFIISLLGAYTHFTWQSRFSKEFPFILSILCQLLTIVALMYAHPYIWLKYIWFIFGLATAVMIHPDLNKNNRQSVSTRL